MQPTRERTPSVPWSKYCKKNTEKIEMRECIRFSKDKNNIICNDFNERKDDFYTYNQFGESNTSNLPTRKMHPFPCNHPETGAKIQLVVYKNEFNDVIVWTDGSADPRTKHNSDPKSGISCWFGDNWYTSQSSPFTQIPEMADIIKYTNSNLSSNETEACAILMALIIADKYKFTFNIEIRTDNMQCVLKIKTLQAKPSNDYIMQLIGKYIWKNLCEGREVMITFVPRDSDYGNKQADALAFEARKGTFGHQFGSAVEINVAKAFNQLNENRSCPQTKDLHRHKLK